MFIVIDHILSACRTSEMAAKNPTDLEDLVTKWAWEMFDYTKTKEQAKIPRDNLQMTVNWKHVRFSHHDPFFEEIAKPKAPKAQTLFKTYFSNSTNQEQEYSFKTERTTTSTCEVSIENGFTVGQELCVSLKTPCEVFEANAGFHRELSLTESHGQTIEESLTWAVDSQIKVSPHHKTIAQLVVTEDQVSSKFSVKSTFSGKIHVTITNLKENNSFVRSIDGNIVDIVKREVDNGLKGFTVDRGSVSFTTKGSCTFNYAIEQHVKLYQEELHE